MKIICNKKSNIIICVGDDIISYDDDRIIDNDTQTIFDKKNIVLYDMDISALDNTELFICPYKYMVSNGTIVKNPTYREPYTLSEEMYTSLISNVDYLMLLNDPDTATE